MICISIRPNESGDGGFQASGNQVMGWHSDTYTLQGKMGTKQADGVTDVALQMTYAADSKVMRLSGGLRAVDGSVQGTWKFAGEGLGGDFVFKRSPEYLLVRPTPAVISKSPVLARWKFVLDAVHYRAQKKLWSSSYFHQRFKDRRRYVELATTRRSDSDRAAESAAYSELTDIYQRLTPSDVQFYASIVRHNLKHATNSLHGYYFPIFFARFHLIFPRNIACGNCEKKLEGSRIVCLECCGAKILDLCDSSRCLQATIDRGKDDSLLPQSSHLPTHDILKSRTAIHGPFHGMVERQAKSALKAARKIFECVEGGSLNPPKPACLACRRCVSMPCWVCIECEG
jgi:hypothetical protein